MFHCTVVTLRFAQLSHEVTEEDRFVLVLVEVVQHREEEAVVIFETQNVTADGEFSTLSHSSPH